MKALALCHNVTPVLEEAGEGEEGEAGEEGVKVDEEVVIFQSEKVPRKQRISYQASSPDEVHVHVHVYIVL